jgi:hypothetical protein
LPICSQAFFPASSEHFEITDLILSSLCSGFKTHTTNTGAAYLVYSTGRYCTSEYTSATSALRLDQYGAHPTLVIPTPAAVGSGLAVLDAVTVAWERSDLKLFSGDARPVVGEEVLGLLTGL